MSSMIQVAKLAGKHSSKLRSVKLNRGPVNSLNTALMGELQAVIQELEKDPEVEGIVLSSTSKVRWSLFSYIISSIQILF